MAVAYVGTLRECWEGSTPSFVVFCAARASCDFRCEQGKGGWLFKESVLASGGFYEKRTGL